MVHLSIFMIHNYERDPRTALDNGPSRIEDEDETRVRQTRKFDGPSSRFEFENKLKFFVSGIFKKLGEVKNGSSRQFGR